MVCKKSSTTGTGLRKSWGRLQGWQKQVTGKPQEMGEREVDYLGWQAIATQGQGQKVSTETSMG